MNGADGSLDGDLVALLRAHEGLAERGFLADGAVHGVGLLRADDLIGRHLAAGLEVHDGDGAADAHGVGRALALVDDDDMEQNVLQLGDAGVELALLVLRLIVFAVLAQVAEAARLFDQLRDFFFTDGLEVGQLILQLLLARRAHLELFFHVVSFPCAAFRPLTGRRRRTITPILSKSIIDVSAALVKICPCGLPSSPENFSCISPPRPL